MSASAGARRAVVIVAAGSGERLGRGIPKAAVTLDGESILSRCLRQVRAAGVAAEICVVIPDGDDGLAAMCANAGVATVTGGPSRAQSVRNALAVLPETKHVLIHDAARPLAPPAVFRRVAAALDDGAVAVIPAVPVVDTIKQAFPDPEESDSELVHRTVDRRWLRAVQTPQGFDLAALKRAHASGEAAELTDDAMAMEAAGYPVNLVAGSPLSRKITTETDLIFAAALIRAVSESSPESKELP